MVGTGFEPGGVGSLSQITLSVAGMSCNHCKMAVEKALLKVPGVSRAEVDLTGAKAVIDYDPAATTRDMMVAAVEDAGYTVPA